VYAVGCPPLTLDARFMAAVLACGDAAVLSHFSAAALWGMLAWEDRRPEVVVVASTMPRRTGLNVHRARVLHRHDVTRHRGIPVTSPARTLLDIAPELSPRALRRAMRQGCGDGRVDLRRLGDVLGRANGHRGAGPLALLVGAGAVPTRSVFEDLLLDLLLGAGLPAPDVNVPIVLAGRRVIPDLRWPRQRLVVEAGGAAWHDNAVARRDDVERQALLEAHGERVLRVTWDQAIGQPQQTIARVRGALAAGG
jgi:hypothetical protein